MRSECVDAVTKAAGRALTQQEVKDIEDRIARNQRQLAVKDRNQYLAMSREQRLREAGRMAAEEILAEAQKKKERAALAIQRHDAIQTFMDSQKDKQGLNTLDSLKRVLAVVNDGKSNFQGIETRASAITKDYLSQLVDTFEAINPRIMGLFTNEKGIRALTHELFGQDSSGIVDAETAKAAKEAAKQWTSVADSAREQFNGSGGKIGRLMNWRMPQHHSQFLVAKAGEDAWVRSIFGKLDRSRYVNADGSMMSDGQVMGFLKEAWLEIATGGVAGMEPGQFRTEAMLANAHAKRRALHFKDADSYLEYSKEFSGKDSYSVMLQHIQEISHDIATVETLGPNPDHAFNYWLEKGVKEETVANPKRAGKVQAKAEDLRNLYDYMSGNSKPIASQRLAEGFDTLRSWLVATKLGSAFITSITDNATMQLTAAVNNLSHMQLMRNQLAILNPANSMDMRLMRRAGLGLNTLMGQVNRFGSESMVPNFASKAASLTTRVSLLNAATEARRSAFGATMYGSVGSTVKRFKSLAGVEAGDRKLLESKGITDTDFQVWKKASLEDWGSGNDTMLTPESIRNIPDAELAQLGNPKAIKREAILKLIGMVDEEMNMAVIEPGAAEKSMTKMGTQPGTWKGEITRSFFLFKSFPIATITKHWRRGINQSTPAGKAAYLGSFIAGTTLMGAAAQQISQIIAGKDPQDMTNGKFWLGSLMKGGSLGIYGDFLFSTNTQYGNSPLATLAGPVAGYTEDMIGLTHGTLMKAAKGEKTHAGAEAIKFVKGNIPLQNLWYTKAVTDRLIFNQLQEMVSPGYMARVESRARKEFKQSYYWKPGRLTPDRAPDLEKAIGQ